MLTACGDTVYQETGSNNKASVNSVVITDGPVSSAIISVTEKRLSPSGDAIEIYVESFLTNTSLADAYTTATVSAFTAGGLEVISFPCIVKLKPGETGKYGVLNSISTGAYALIKEWRTSEVWHLPITPSITPPQESLDGKYLQTGHIYQTERLPFYVLFGTSSAESETVSPSDSLLIIDKGIWDQKITTQDRYGSVANTTKSDQYTMVDGKAIIAAIPLPFSIADNKITVVYPKECTDSICTTVTITWDKVSD